MENIIEINQEIFSLGSRSYEVKMTVIQGGETEVIEFNYDDSNGIYPLYNSLISTIRGIEDAHVDLLTSDKVFVEEVNGSPNRNSSLLGILNNVKQTQGVTINALLK